MVFRAYDRDRDRDAVHRIWREAGWIESGQEPHLDIFVDACRSRVAEIDGAAECLVLTTPGTVRHLHADIPMSCVAAVTTSRVARKQGFAGRLTAQAIAADAADGAHVSALGMFEQGFYNRLGFGTGAYEHMVSLDPSRLRLPDGVGGRAPRRITTDDWQAIHASRLGRARGHGACNLDAGGVTQADMLLDKNSFGLGFADGPGGELTHHLWCRIKGDVEQGPYDVKWMAWQTPAQFIELMAVLKSLGDQVHLVKVREPAGVQLQDLLARPFHRSAISRQSPFEATVRSVAYWQMRICDVPACLAQTRLPAGEARFNLRLTDPIERLLNDVPWRGVAGDYVITLGPSSGAEAGHDDTLSTLTATVNAFTRLWLGVRPASGLGITDELDGPIELLEQLDEVLRLPAPHPDWDF